MAERGLSVDHVTVWRWVQRYAPVLNQRIRRELRRPNRSWRVDETYVKVAGKLGLLVPCRRGLTHLGSRALPQCRSRLRRIGSPGARVAAPLADVPCRHSTPHRSRTSKVGQRVGVGFFGGEDGTCMACRRGETAYCQNPIMTRITTDGGYAQMMIAEARALAVIPDELKSEDAAPLRSAALESREIIAHFSEGLLVPAQPPPSIGGVVPVAAPAWVLQ
jgi:hypothetical protein